MRRNYKYYSPETPPRKGDTVYKRNENGELEFDYVFGEEKEARDESYYKKLANEILRKGQKLI